MGCCNKTHVGKPIGPVRYYGGLVLLGGAQATVLGVLATLSVPFPRYRKVLPFYLEFAHETFDSVRRRERINFQLGSDPDACERRA